MIDRELFIDSVGEIDLELLAEHITRKIPTRAQKIRRYAMAVAAYAAAVIAVAVILPFIIGKGDDPSPVPGDDPIVTETHSPQPEDPELTEINVSDINRVYNGVDPENLPVNVSLDEVNAIISAAVQAYEDYDVVVLENGDRLRTLPKDPHITFGELGEDGMMTDAAMEYLEYNKNVFYVIREALASRFPERARYGGGVNLVMDINSTGHADAESYFDAKYHGDAYYRRSDEIVMELSSVIQHIFYWPANEELVEIYPTARDLDIFNILTFGDVRSGEMYPTATASADGLELSVFMTDLITTDAEASFTVVLENTGDSDVTLLQGYLGDYIDEVTVYENGVIRPDKSAQSGYSESEQTRVLKPGEYIIYRDTISMTKEDKTPAMNSSWEYEAKAEYIPNGGDEHETLTVKINLPRDKVENTVPDPDTITVGLDGKSYTFDSVSEYYYYELITRRASRLLSENDVILVYRDIQESDITGLRNGGVYAELVYSEECSIYLNGEDTATFDRIMFAIEDGTLYMILGEDGGYSKTQVYSLSAAEELLSAIRSIIDPETTRSETVAPTTEAPAVTPPPAENVQPVTPDDAADVTVHVQVTEPSDEIKNKEENTTTKEPAATTTRKPAVTTEKVTYPDPYESNKTDTSVTKTFYGCDYTLSVDKAKCEPGDIITVTVSLENKGQSRIDLYDYYYSYDRWTGVTHKNFLDRVSFKVAGIGAYDYSGEGYTKRTSLMPGETMSYTTKIDTTDAYVKASWSVVCEIYFAVDGEMYYQNNSLLIEHDGCVNWPYYTDDMYNPFDNTRYENTFKGNGEIVVTFSSEASKYWEKYLGPEYFGYYGLDDPNSDSPVYSPQFDPYEIEEIKLHEDTTGQCVTVSIFLKDKDEVNVNSAVSFLHEISVENDGAITHAYPVQANYFVK